MNTKTVKKKKNTNGILILTVLGISVITIAVFIFNIFNVASKSSNASTSTLELDKNSSISNSLYSIGNNPTPLLRDNFKELTAAIKKDDPHVIAEYVARCFVIDHFTWTNKDGNYEVGGLQYVYGPKFTSFSEENRYGFYKDLDLYIQKYGRENLIEVESIESAPALDAVDYNVNGETYKAYYLDVTWTYKKSSAINVDEFQKVGHFTIINNNGRYEIVSMYDDWDAQKAE
ncbi:MAG: hypothetical protein MR601_04845 [Erysipelotrichaceae bacterium]|nr:hypothetical protein [Erysipelotrichaceae bacterium]